MSSDYSAMAKMLADLTSERDAARRDLAECFRLSGADPDGDEDWRLAPRAVLEVRRLRAESDESIKRIAELEETLLEVERSEE